MPNQPTPVDTSVVGPAKTGKKPYFWGRLFVRLAMVLAILSLVATVAICVQQSMAMRRKLANHAFRPTSPLLPALQQTEIEYEQALELFAELYPSAMDGKAWAVTSPQRVRKTAELEAAAGAAAQMRANVDSLRQRVLTQFNDPVQGLIDGMESKVGKVREGLQDKNQAKVSAAQERIRQLMRRMDPTASFYGPMDMGEYRRRMVAVDSCQDLLRALHTMTKSKKAHGMMEKGNLALIRIREAFPEPLSELVVAKLNDEIDKERARIADLMGGGAKLKGEEMAHRLDQLMLAVNEGFSTAWKIDGELDTLDAVLRENADLLEEGERERQDVLWEAVLQMGWSGLAGACFAFFLLVSADFLQAHFDTAEHTRRLGESGPSV
ncbi:MAG: hypothetical protein HN849_02330 [Victivallales bacterium]|nr:hypothetical protein [Victivallales bacterium]